MSPIIEVNNLSKSFLISHEGNKESYTALRDVVAKKAKKIFSFPSSSIKKTVSKEEFWALKDVSFNIEQGDRVGIIGRNGAGKSTLLKILSRITEPTKGGIKIRGRVASLLEVGTGFHPELTGRENIFLNGAILGMSRAEIRSKFDEIVNFSEVERFLDTPVKRYSSGMYVRLAFAVAAHLEPEILIVDEVLAVGDAQFQQKCLGKMEDVSREGRTVLFVSHNIPSIKALCKTGILLKQGQLEMLGNIEEVIDKYANDGFSKANFSAWNEYDAPGNEHIRLKSFKIFPTEGEELNIESGVAIEIHFYNFKKNINLAAGIFLFTSDSLLLFEAGLIISENNDSKSGLYKIKATIPSHLLNAGYYKISVLFAENQAHILYKHDELGSFELIETYFGRGNNLDKVPGIIRPKFILEKELSVEIN